MIWSRYFDTSEGVLDSLDDVVDSCNPLWFWTMCVFIPNYPFYKVVSEGNLGGFAGVVVYLLTVVRLAENFIALFNFKASLAARARKEVGGLIWATTMYYFFWWFSPKFILDMGLYLSLYIFYPAMFVVSIMAIAAPKQVVVMAN